jgi:nucleoside-diphosphate-sugar epimerase
MEKILVTGALGQIGTELVPALRKKYGQENVIASDIRVIEDGSLFVQMDILKKAELDQVIRKHRITTIYHLAGMISAVSEKEPIKSRDINLGGLFNVLDLAREHKIKIFWPSSIAAFGKNTPKHAPQHTITEPDTIYGAAKVAGELFCKQYHRLFGVDVRSVRYPGVLSYKTPPGGGTTDYASFMAMEAVRGNSYICFLKKDATLPMMLMDDALKATIELMDSPPEKVMIRTSYNLASVSFSPQELEDEIKKHIPSFSCTYVPDFRQKIAESWPQVILDDEARRDWGWKPEFDLAKMTKVMLEGFRTNAKK